MKRRWTVLLCVAAAACAPTTAEVARQEKAAAKQRLKLDQALAGLTPGPAIDCLSGVERRTANTQVYGSTVLFRISSSRMIRNDMNGNCPELARDPIVVTSTPTDQLCRGDIARLIDRTSRFPMGACIYGPFVPYGKGS